MGKKTLSLLCALATCAVGVSCERLPKSRLVVDGPLAVQAATFADAVPLEYGSLVAITPQVGDPHIAGLWFEKADKTIVYIRVNVTQGTIGANALILPRR